MFPLKDNIPTERFPVVTVALIAINVFVFLFLQHPSGFSSVDDETVVKYGAIPYALTHPGKHCGLGDRVTPGGVLVTSQHGTVACEGKVVQTSEGPTKIRAIAGSQPPAWLTIFTAMFMHGGFLHIIGNMLFLWIFGNNVEDAMGPLKYLAFYLLSGVAALALQVAFNPDSTVPTIGASGAIAGVLGGYILLYPRARVLTLIFLIFFVTFIEVPAVLVLGVWFLEQLYFGVADLSHPTGGGVAYFAHIGGFAFGLIFIRAFATRIRRPPEPRLPAY
ncbi:MAG TPA: rhomboid family intramembrane serine protease [Solirubrobacteraceae bacterium]|nr:rhomboid family intramembrane serine protease [Solirubrobacteraceae bacterium]